jgi:tRNA pseudouridine13 synthase
LHLEQLAGFRNAGEGTRRPLRLLADELHWEAGGKCIELGFVLPKGGYATTLLENVCRLVDDVNSRPAVDGRPAAAAGEAEPLTPLPASPDLGSDDREHSTFPQ